MLGPMLTGRRRASDLGGHLQASPTRGSWSDSPSSPLLQPVSQHGFTHTAAAAAIAIPSSTVCCIQLLAMDQLSIGGRNSELLSNKRMEEVQDEAGVSGSAED
jgi:hypothetical protein